MKHDGWKRFIVCIAIVWIGVASAHAWQIETIDAGGSGAGWGISLELDSGGVPHISTFDVDSSELKHVWKSGSGWVDETIDSGNFLMENSIAVNEDDFPSVCYSLTNLSDFNDLILKYAWKDGDGWHTETVDENGFCGGYSSLAIDSAGNPHLSYYNSEEDELRYAWKDGAGWHIEIVDDSGYCWSSIALDSNGYPHISCASKYAWKDGAGWHIETADTEGAISSSLSLDSAGYPHISYAINGEWYLRYAWKDTSGWHSERVAGGCGTAEGCIWDVQSLALDGNDMPHISYLPSGDLNYAWKDASGWHTQTVDSVGGMWDAIVVDGNNVSHICYDNNQGRIKYAICAPENPVATDDDYYTWEDIPLDVPAPGVLENDIYPNMNSLEAMLVSGTAHGTVTLHMNGSFVYVPDAGYIGLDSFTYVAYDGELTSQEATVFLKVYDSYIPGIPTPEFPSVQPVLCVLVCVAFTVLLLRGKKD